MPGAEHISRVRSVGPNGFKGSIKMIKRNLLVMGLAVLLSACGFQLRGTGTTELAIKELDVSARNAYGETVTQLTRLLTSSGVKVYTGAPYKLMLTNEAETQRAISYSGSGRSAEYQLTNTLTYEVHGDRDRFLLGDKVTADRSYVHDGNNLTGSDQEAAQVRQEMRNDLIQKMMARLQQMTPSRLDELQAKADAAAKAEADALEAAQRIRDETPQQSPVEVPGR
ncbi:LPS-assembly lipoprotein LptE [Pseudomonas syringae pv. helianthi]|uniref:LPS-assembly lipoprotein LptE n=2 Tax=Pseudomonas TaxID=286 RepID=A0A3M6CKA9_9PSED|nr:LPS-assembly lipoprotein LptE [Pseudomonas syringae pv. helianthi]